MALKPYAWTFTQEEAATSWEINNIPEGALYPAIQNVELSGGRIFTPSEDDQRKAPYGIELLLGVTPESGVAIGTYYIDAPEDTTTVTSGANTVNITVTQNGGTAPTGATF